MASRTPLIGAGPSPIVTPDDFANLSLWVRSDLGVTKDGSDFVSAWADQSGNGYNLSGGSPLWQDAQINGYPSILFDGSNDQLNNTTNNIVSDPSSIFFVIKVVSATANDCVLAGTNSASRIVQDNSSNHSQDGQNAVTLTTGTWHLFHSLWNGVSSSQEKNDDGSVSGGNAVGNWADFYLGSRPVPDRYANFEIAELVAYDDEKSGDDLTRLKTYFNNRYALW